jgi:uncharacterized tellurite resistance protein B-like protein
VLRGSGRSSGIRVKSKGKGGGGAGVILLISVALLIIGYIGVFFGNLIKAAVSRSREFLADASAVQFTRNPSGISGALKKIGGLADGSRIMHANATQASHLFFANGLSGFWTNLFATHPPLDKRIKAIEPGFDGEFPVVKKTSSIESPRSAIVSGLDDSTVKNKTAKLDPAFLLATVGSPTAEHIAYSSRLMTSIPNQLRLAVLDKIGAQAAVSALLLSADPPVRERQDKAVLAADARLAPRVVELEPIVRTLERSSYATICSLSINSLKSMDKECFRSFSQLLKSLIEADTKIDLFEYMLMHMVRRYLEPRFSRNVKPGPAIGSKTAVLKEIASLLSILAWESADSPAQAENAFSKGLAALPGTSLSLIPREQSTFSALDQSLKKLDQLVPLQKRQVLNACVAVAATDGVFTINEAEYLRVVADSLDCPIPPVILS